MYPSNFMANKDIYLFKDFREYVVMPLRIGNFLLTEFKNAKNRKMIVIVLA